MIRTLFKNIPLSPPMSKFWDWTIVVYKEFSITIATAILDYNIAQGIIVIRMMILAA